MTFENGSDFNRIYFEDSTQVLEQGFAKDDGTRHGEWNAFYKDGTLRVTGHYVEGQKEGLWKMFDSKGKAITTGNFQNGIPDGPWIWYYQSGKKYFERTYKNGFKEGIWNGYYENGNQYGTANFIKGEIESGEIYSENGDVIDTETLGKVTEFIVKLEMTNGAVEGEKEVSKEILWNFAIQSLNPKMLKELADSGSEIKQSYIDKICQIWYDANKSGGGSLAREKLIFYDLPETHEHYKRDFGTKYNIQLQKDKEGAEKNYKKNAEIIASCIALFEALSAYDISVRKCFFVKMLSVSHADDARFSGSEIEFLWNRSKMSIDETFEFFYPFEASETKDLMDIALDSLYIEPTVIDFLIKNGLEVNDTHLFTIAQIRESYYRDLTPDEDGVFGANYDANDLKKADNSLQIVYKRLQNSSLPNAILQHPEIEINARALPSGTSSLVRTMFSGELVKILEYSDNLWLHVKTADGKKGFVLKQYCHSFR